MSLDSNDLTFRPNNNDAEAGHEHSTASLTRQNGTRLGTVCPRRRHCHQALGRQSSKRVVYVLRLALIVTSVKSVSKYYTDTLAYSDTGYSYTVHIKPSGYSDTYLISQMAFLIVNNVWIQ